jgi:hypothetical protein
MKRSRLIGLIRILTVVLVLAAAVAWTDTASAGFTWDDSAPVTDGFTWDVAPDGFTWDVAPDGFTWDTTAP